MSKILPDNFYSQLIPTNNEFVYNKNTPFYNEVGKEIENISELNSTTENNISVSGRITYLNLDYINPMEVPLAGVTVRIENFVVCDFYGNCYPNPFTPIVRYVTTDANGYYYLSDWAIRSTKVSVEAKNIAADMHWLFPQVYSIQATQITGNIVANIQVSSSQARILENMLKSYNFSANAFGFTRPRINVIYNAGSGLAYFSSNDEIKIYENYTSPSGLTSNEIWGARGREVHSHEYGHAVMYSAFGNYMPLNNGTVPSPHYLNSPSHPEFAWKEGWAEFYSAAVFPEEVGNGLFALEINSFGNSPYYKGGRGPDGNLVPPNNTDGRIVEGAVATHLWNIFDAVSTIDGRYGDNDDANGYATALWNAFKTRLVNLSLGQEFRINSNHMFMAAWDNYYAPNYIFNPPAQGPVSINEMHNFVMFGIGDIPPTTAGNLTFSLQPNQVKLNWSDHSDWINNETGFKVERKLSNSNWQEIATLGQNVNYFLDSDIPAQTKYRVRSYRNTTNSIYSNEITIPVISPIISNLLQSPNPIYRGSSGTVTCNLSQGNGNLNYAWLALDSKPGVSVTFSGNRAYITFDYNMIHNSSIKNKEYPIEVPEGIELECTVSNSSGTDVRRYVVKFATTPHGCPFVYTWNGGTWVEDNNILPQSQDSALFGGDVTDFYQLYTKPILEDDKYYIAVGEFEQEKSYLDQLKLLVVDHQQETFITVDDNGEIIQFAKPAYFANAQLDSTDVLKKLFELDSIKANVSENDTLKLSFENISIGDEKWLMLIGQQPPIAKDQITGNVLKGGKENSAEFSSFRLRKNPTYQWILAPEANSSSLQIDIAFKSEAEIDYTELSHQLELPFIVYTPQLLYAEHSLQGDVTNKLNQFDEDYAQLKRDEMILLDYSAPPINEGMERTFIFVSRGRYERLENSMLAKSKTQLENQFQANSNAEKSNIVYEYELSQNYPNPFNPVTTISYQIKKQGLVQLKVYNLLGQEIITLVHGEQPGGKYEAIFDASNLPSGTYIYTLRVNDFVQNNKLIFLK